MSIEIERKYLVVTPPALDGLRAQAIRQGYLSKTGDIVEVRVRQKGEGFFLTVKSGGTVERTEHEVALSGAQFDALWPATQGRRVEKTRHSGALPGGLTFELDIYEAPLAPLMVVEVEFSSRAEADAFVPPDWFGADVSADKRFKNKALAVADAPPEM